MKNSEQAIAIAEDEVEFMFGDIIREGTEGIGTSDTNICAKNIKQRCARADIEVDDHTIRSLITNEMFKIENNIK